MTKTLLKIKKNNFLIKFSEGINFAKKSKDFNPIHINKIYGYNSIFGQNIIHGVLLIISFFNKAVIQKKYGVDQVYIKFLKPAVYNNRLIISQIVQKKKIFFFSIFQNKQLVCEIKIKLSEVKNFINKNQKRDLGMILKKISWYTGMKYPGLNSLIYDISINLKEKNTTKKFKINSRKLDKRLPIIQNNGIYKNYAINFTSIIRPYVKKTKGKPSVMIKKNVKKINHNVLIIGASQGIGKSLFNIVNKNSKINIIGTYLRNKIKIKKKKIIIKKIDITKNLLHLKRIISKYSPIKIYYFASPKILFDKKIDPKKLKEFRNYFVKYPLKLLNQNRNNISSFFYPSTEFINFDKKAPYSIIKVEAEKKIKKFCANKNINFVYHRFPAINSRQSISISNPQNQDLISYLNKNKKIINKMLS